MTEQPKPSETDEDAHDVLAADEFPVGSIDASLSPAHDVLAADEFAVGSGDPALHRSAFEPPADPSGIEEPHDVLAAEEFAVPAGPVSGARTVATPGRIAAVTGALLAAGAATFSILRRRRSGSRLDRLRQLRP